MTENIAARPSALTAMFPPIDLIGFPPISGPPPTVSALEFPMTAPLHPMIASRSSSARAFRRLARRGAAPRMHYSHRHPCWWLSTEERQEMSAQTGDTY